MKTKIIRAMPALILMASGAWYIWETLKTPKALGLFIAGLILKRQLDKKVVDPIFDEAHWTQVHAIGYANHTHTKLSPNKCPECNLQLTNEEVLN